MKLIVATDKAWGIGYQGDLLVSIPDDMKFFRETTSGHVLVMGRKTLDSFPGGRPLKNRVNIVLTRDRDFQRDGVVVIHQVEELEEKLKEYDNNDVFVIGGESIYRQLLSCCDTAYVTRIDHTYKADTYFPDLDVDAHWELYEEGEERIYNDISYRFCTFRQKR